MHTFFLRYPYLPHNPIGFSSFFLLYTYFDKDINKSRGRNFQGKKWNKIESDHTGNIHRFTTIENEAGIKKHASKVELGWKLVKKWKAVRLTIFLTLKKNHQKLSTHHTFDFDGTKVEKKKKTDERSCVKLISCWLLRNHSVIFPMPVVACICRHVIIRRLFSYPLLCTMGRKGSILQIPSTMNLIWRLLWRKLINEWSYICRIIW